MKPGRRDSGVTGLWTLNSRLSTLLAPLSETADVWLIQLRWVAIVGMLGTIVVAHRLVPSLLVRPPLIVLAAIVALNIAWSLAPRRRVDLQIYADVLALTAMLWVTGGASNPFAAFLTFHIVLAGLLCGARTAIAIAALTLVAILGLRLAPPLPAAAAGALHLGIAVSLASLAAFMCFFVLLYVRRVADLREEGARNEKLAILGRLVGSMSHELNTPLATILLASRELLEVAGSDDARSLARTIADEAQRASDVIGMMRGQIRPDQNPAPVDLTALVRELAAKELDRLGFTGDRVLPPVEPAVTATVISVGVRHVLTNLLANAVQAPAKKIVVAVTVKPGRVELAVSDDGPGIDRELLPSLGEPFQTTKDTGMGLGLYISTLLAERMNGSIRVETPSAGGTRVILSLHT